jgi:RNA polymerase sigma factor (sigma-70 family)
MSTDSDRLLRYADNQCEHAFAELVRTHLDLVYSAAARRVGGDTHAAMEITQEVFLSMARHARRLARHPVLSAWLHTSTRNAAANYHRRENRKERQKQQVQAMQELQSNHAPSAQWADVRDVLDEALDELNARDRQTIILRFFEGRSYPEISRIVGLRDEAVRMRVGRALEKLRILLERRGVASTAAILGGALSTHSVTAAPAGFAATVVATATAATATTLATTPIAGVFHLMSMTKSLTVVAGLTVVFGVSALSFHHARTQTSSSAPAVTPTGQPPLAHEPDGKTPEGLDSVVADHLARHAERISPETIHAEEKIAALRDVLGRLPEQAIPELKLATNGDWHAAVDGPLETTEDYRRALGKIRSSAERRFAASVQPALREYLRINADQFPSETIQLQPFVGAEIDHTMLQRYRVVPASEIPNVRMGGDWIMTQTALIDSAYDASSVIGPRGFGSTTVPPGRLRAAVINASREQSAVK